MKSSPTQRSLKYCRDLGWFCAITEHWNQFAKIRQDLFGFIDIVALTPDHIVAIQTTTSAHLAERIAKAQKLPGFWKWLEGGGKIEFHGWSKRGERGKRKLWTLRREIFDPTEARTDRPHQALRTAVHLREFLDPPEVPQSSESHPDPGEAPNGPNSSVVPEA